MTESTDDPESLLSRIREHEQEIQRLRTLLASRNASRDESSDRAGSASAFKRKWPLEREEYKRYGRQLILPELGIHGQLKLRDAKVLIVGIGGLGCPAAQYLASAGIGTLGLMDGDTVDLSNLHRQVLHSTETRGMLKVHSAELSLKRLNPMVRYKLHPYHLEPQTAVADFLQYDLVLDCIPLISGAALRTDGQLYVLNFPPFNPAARPDYVNGPCYRCVHPKPPPADALVTCAEGGILGPVVGTIGVLMATETIKILSSSTYSAIQSIGLQDGKKSEATHTMPLANIQGLEAPAPSMLMYSAYANPPFRSVRLRGRRPNCSACSPDAALRTVSTESLKSGTIDYITFCGQLTTQMLAPDERMTPEQVARARKLSPQDGTLLLDVRNSTEFNICSLSESMHVPLNEVKNKASEIAAKLEEEDIPSLVAVCRFGNDSQMAAKILQEEFKRRGSSVWIGDLRGGLAAWTRDVDHDFPDY